MIHRLVKPIISNSFFLFGARGTGKTTWLQTFFRLSRKERGTYYADLFDNDVFDRLSRDPKIIERLADERTYEWIILDEIQRVPSLLNTVQRCIEKYKQKFVLTGSSARKLKRGAGNLLAGRAFVYQMFPFTSLELGDRFSLDEALQWGTLPKLQELPDENEKKAYLRSYGFTYLKEEILMEQLIRKLDPFRDFLEVAAQSAGKVINYSKISRDVGVEVVSIQKYFQILSDTYLGFYLPAFHRSIRKSQREQPKFYFFDNGVKKSLERSLDSKPTPGTSQYGELFEAFLIQEIHRLNQYRELDYKMSFFRTKNGVEIDLILSKPGRCLLIEIKSSSKKDIMEVQKLSRLRKDFGGQALAFYLSRDRMAETVEGVRCLHWQEFLDNVLKDAVKKSSD